MRGPGGASRPVRAAEQRTKSSRNVAVAPLIDQISDIGTDPRGVNRKQPGRAFSGSALRAGLVRLTGVSERLHEPGQESRRK